MADSKIHPVTVATKETIPLIDFSPFLVDEGVAVGKPPTDAQRKVAQCIDSICREHGFLAMTNFGISASERDQLFAESAALFALPDDVKRQQLTRIAPATNTGYCPLQSECINRSRPPELKEAFNFRFPPHHKNPLDNCPPTLGPFVEQVLLPKYIHLAQRYAVACAVALEIPDIDFFARTLQKFDLCTLRMLHYPPCDWDDTNANDPADLSCALRIGEHTDFGFVTFLMVHPDHGPEGLQIKAVDGGEVGGQAAGESEGWHDVVLPPTEGREPVIIVNTGALMARWTNDEWKATAHRVIVPDAAAAARSRYSIACFIDPDVDSMVAVHPSFVSKSSSSYQPIKSIDYLMQKLQSMMKA